MNTNCSRAGGVTIYALAIVAGLAFAVAMALPAIQRAWDAGSRTLCYKNLVGVALGLLNYEHKNGCFPPAVVTDRAGKPLYSWRVLVLPYTEDAAIYPKLHLEEPWDSPHNLQFARQTPGSFRCPADTHTGKGDTSYMAVVGPHTVWPGTKPVSLKDVTDGHSNTILVVEVAGSGVNWMEPRDMTFEEALAGVDADWKGPRAGEKLRLRSRHRSGVSYALCDNTVHELDKNMPTEVLKALLTRDGGETISYTPHGPELVSPSGWKRK